MHAIKEKVYENERFPIFERNSISQTRCHTNNNVLAHITRKLSYK